MEEIKVTLMSYNPEMLELIYSSYRQCYSEKTADDIMEKALTGDPAYLENFIANCMKRGHLSPLEHATFTFNIQGCSRVCTHQLVRHRLASYSQQSQRYVKVKDKELPCVIPESINVLCNAQYKRMLKNIYVLYDYMIAKGVPIEDARYILPEGMRTNIVVTMNIRELLHFFHERLCGKAQDEIREIAGIMAGLVIKVAPWLKEFIGPKCQGKDKCMDNAILCAEHYHWRLDKEDAINVEYQEKEESKGKESKTTSAD